MMPAKDITGARFGRLVAVERVVGEKKKYSYWRMRCDCGDEVVCLLHNLQSGAAKSCGCLLREVGIRNLIHGDARKDAHTRLYRIWSGMKARCYSDHDSVKVRLYRDRGITVCDEWRDDFPAFKAWALTNGYRDHLTIDRQDNDLGYAPGNCRWATVRQQLANRRPFVRRNGHSPPVAA